MASTKPKLPEHLFDNSTIASYERCARYGFFRHERNWVRSGSALAPTFGTCWHSGQDIMYGDRCGKPILTKQSDIDAQVDRCMTAFMESWNSNEDLPQGLDLKDKEIKKSILPHHPDTAFHMYHGYLKQRASFLNRIELVAIERPFIVPIFEDDSSIGYTGLIDKTLIHWNEGRLILDHKSTKSFSKLAGFRLDYIEGFNPSAQFTGYVYATNILDDSPCSVAWADCSLVHKDAGDPARPECDVHKFVPIRFSDDSISEWIAETRMKIETILDYRHRLQRGRFSYPRNTSACTNRGICPYKDICIGSTDYAEVNMPSGFEISTWSPVAALLE